MGGGGGEGEHECIKIRLLQMSHIKDIKEFFFFTLWSGKLRYKKEVLLLFDLES